MFAPPSEDWLSALYGRPEQAKPSLSTVALSMPFGAGASIPMVCDLFARRTGRGGGHLPRH